MHDRECRNEKPSPVCHLWSLSGHPPWYDFPAAYLTSYVELVDQVSRVFRFMAPDAGGQSEEKAAGSQSGERGISTGGQNVTNRNSPTTTTTSAAQCAGASTQGRESAEAELRDADGLSGALSDHVSTHSRNGDNEDRALQVVRSMTVKDIISGMKKRSGAIPMPSSVQRAAERRKRRKRGVDPDAQSEAPSNVASHISESDRSDIVVAPQVTLDEEGNIVIDQDSLVVSAGKAINAEKERGNVTTVENLAVGSQITSASYAKRESAVKWEPTETEKFYNALRAFGTDFSLMESMFPGRSRRQLKLKFKREERDHPDRIDFAMRNRSTPCTANNKKGCAQASNAPNTIQHESARVISTNAPTQELAKNASPQRPTRSLGR